MTTTNEQEQSRAYILAGLFTLSLRLVVGWTYFSAFWRRLVLENKLIPDSAGYIYSSFCNWLFSGSDILPWNHASLSCRTAGRTVSCQKSSDKTAWLMI